MGNFDKVNKDEVTISVRILKFIEISGYGTKHEKQDTPNNLLHVEKISLIGRIFDENS